MVLKAGERVTLCQHNYCGAPGGPAAGGVAEAMGYEARMEAASASCFNGKMGKWRV